MKQELTHSFGQVGRVRILVVGDFFLDTYTLGKAKRISPEAPVAVVHVKEEKHLPGGAGNVVLNLVSLGADVVAMGRMGGDRPGFQLKNAMAEEGVSVTGLLEEEGYSTPIKNRIIADHQQIVRVDSEVVTPLTTAFEQSLIADFPRLLQDVDVITVSDYGKGTMTETLMQALVTQAREIPIIVDPKGVDFIKYRGATMIKPNLSETYAAANLLPDAPLEHAAERILKSTQAKTLMVTRSEAGISLFHAQGEREDFPVKMREILDVTGAGDTVLAMVAFGLANQLPLAEVTQLANIAAGIAIERFGCARVSLSEVARRHLEMDGGSKVFDCKHLFALKEALKGRPYSILHVSEKEGLTPALFQSIRKIGSRKGWDLILYIKEDEPSDSFVDMLASLQDVQFIITDPSVLTDIEQKKAHQLIID